MKQSPKAPFSLCCPDLGGGRDTASPPLHLPGSPLAACLDMRSHLASWSPKYSLLAPDQSFLFLTEAGSSHLSMALINHLLLILIKDGSREATETLAGKKLLAGNVIGRRVFRFTWSLSSAVAVATLE